MSQLRSQEEELVCLENEKGKLEEEIKNYKTILLKKNSLSTNTSKYYLLSHINITSK